MIDDRSDSKTSNLLCISFSRFISRSVCAFQGVFFPYERSLFLIDVLPPGIYHLPSKKSSEALTWRLLSENRTVGRHEYLNFRIVRNSDVLPEILTILMIGYFWVLAAHEKGNG